MLRFDLLGTFEAWRDEVRIDPDQWRTQKTLAVLKILLDARGHVVTTDRLGDLVWPDADPQAARNSVQVAIRAIRTVLEPGLAKGARSRSVVTDRGGYRFDAEGVALDVDAFARSRDAALTAERANDPRRAIEAATAALRTYRGDYLADDPHADWALATRERLHEQYVDLADRATSWLTRSGLLDDAVSWAERALAVDPLREELYAALMRAHIAAGRRAHVALVYERAARVLVSALGMEPSAELRALREQGARAEPVARARTDGMRPGLPFVGRQRELEALRGAWHAARAAPGPVVLVSGHAGIGKTRLAREFSEALERDARVVWLAASESATPTALGPFREALRALRDGASAAQRERIDAEAVRLDAEDDLAARAEVITAAIRVVAGPGRVLVVFDDLHWADAGSLAILGYLARRARPGTLLVATLRSDEPETRALASFVERARTDGLLLPLRLGPLGVEGTRALIQAALPDAASDLAARVHAASGGLPLFVRELVRALADIGPSALDRVPETLQETIAARVRRLATAERDTLSVASVIGAPFRADVVAQARAIPLDDALGALDVLLQRELIRASDDGRAYVVAHPLVERAVYAGLSPGRRALLHRAVADALVASRAAQPAASAAERLRHLIAADSAWRDIADAALAAGEFALARHAYADGARALEAGRDALVRLLPNEEIDAHLAPLRERLGDAYAGLRRADDALLAYGEIFAIHPLPAVVAARLRRKSAVMLGDVQGRLADALALLDEAERELGDVDAPERAEIAAARASILVDQASHAEALAAVDGALALARSAHLEHLVTRALVLRARILESLGRLDEAESLVRDALTRARSRGDRDREADLYARLGSIWNRRSKPREALGMYTRARELRLEIGGETARDLTNYGIALVPPGELVRSRAVLVEAVERARAIGDTYQEMASETELGRTLLQLGDLAAARETLDHAIALADRIGHAERGAYARMRRAETANLEGDLATAERRAGEALRIGEEIGDTFALIGAHQTLSERAVLAGDPGAATHHATIAVEIARERGYRRAESSALVALVDALWLAGRRAEARVQMARAREHYRVGGDAYGRVQELQTYANTLLAKRPRERDRALRDALALAKQIGATALARRIEQALAPRA